MLIDVARDLVEAKRTRLGPGDDWDPLLLYRNRVGQIGIVQLNWPDAQAKQAVFEALPNLLAQVEAIEIATVMSAWSYAASQDEAEWVRPSEHPNRIECLVLIGADAHGEERALMAEIKRSPGRPPELEWDEDPVVSVGGDIMQALRRGLWG